MKTLPVVLATMMALTHAWAAKDVDLSEFDGNYKGNGTIAAFGNSVPLTANVKFNVAKNGSTAKVTLSGIVNVDGGVPWGTTLTLKKKGKMTTSNVLGVDQGGTYPASGKYKLPKSSKITGNAKTTVEMTALAQDVTMSVKPKGKKKQLKVTIKALVDGADYFVYNFTVTGK